MHVDLAGVVTFIGVLLVSMSIHEMMHAFAADWLGDDTSRLQGRLTLNPLAHIDPLLTVALPLLIYITSNSLTGAPVLFGAAKPVQVNFGRLRYGEFGAAIVGIVGPITNFILACIAAILFKDLAPAYGTESYNILSLAIELNVGMFIFNSIPWPPLDGSRLLYAVAPRGLREVMDNIERTGYMSLVIFIFLFWQFGGPIQDVMIKLIHVLAPALA